ncbi:response regulator [Arcobacter roscoffensis]|uniref:Response regulator n=1 Tax=Arcobacter roscoffensis TaxID=2961520 RepID=A0ABY5E7N2_9BACT|nr:response regulator [Arcobacter roscoffensis]UTJ07068.1 response regulator [Arcobacter roscoffensis]
MTDMIERLRELKILFVEDEADLMEIITDALDSLDVEYYSATNGVEALEIFHNNPNINIIATDISMPQMDGLELIKTLKKDKSFDIPIVIMSAHSESEYITEAENLGINAKDYLQKPFDFMNFIKVISNMDIK